MDEVGVAYVLWRGASLRCLPVAGRAPNGKLAGRPHDGRSCGPPSDAASFAQPPTLGVVGDQSLSRDRGHDVTTPSAETFGDLSLTSIDGAAMELAWWDKGSGGRYDGAFYNPAFAELGRAYEGYHFLGSFGVGSYARPSGPMLLVKDVGDGSALRRAEDFRLIWTDRGSGATLDGSFWLPVCDDDAYVALGAVCVRGHGKPDPAGLRVALVHRSLTLRGRIGATRVWDDSRTGAARDFSAWPVEVPTTPVADGTLLLAPRGLAAVASHSRPDSSETTHVLLLPLTTTSDHEPAVHGTRSTSTQRDLPSRSYADRQYAFTTMVCHEGVVVAMAMDEDRRIVYSVLNPGPDGDSPAIADVETWPAEPKELAFPGELVRVGSTIGEPYAVPVFRTGSREPEPPDATLPPPGAEAAFAPDRFLSTTARLTARAPFQVLSDGPHLYVFRQSLTRSVTSERPGSGDGDRPDPVELEMRDRLDMLYADDDGHVLTIPVRGELGYVDEDGNWVDASAMQRPEPLVDGTLLVDRFALVDGSLRPSGEVRFQRSRSRTRPGSASDSLGTKDLDGRPFHEPTIAIASVRNLSRARFAVVAVPAQEVGGRRWQLVASNEKTGRLDILDVARTPDGSIDPTGSPFYTCPYHRTVFSPQPGTCTVDTGHATCRTELVPRVEGSSGAALRLHPRAAGASVSTSGGGWVELSPPAGGASDTADLGDEFTIEAWVRPDADVGTGRQLLAGCWPPTIGDGTSPATTDGTGPAVRASGLWLWLVDGRRLRIGFGDGRRWNQYTTGELLSLQAWNHVAVSLGVSDGVMSLRFTVDGTQREATRSTFAVAMEDEAPQPLTAGPAGDRLLTSIGGPLWPFRGTLTELRLWRRARSERELRVAMHHRLTGLERDLEGYWSLDEADGDRVVDRTDHAVDGTIYDGSWVASEAPVGDHPGITRDCVRVVGANDGAERRIVSPPTATLYFQQTPAAVGYGGADKPMKRAGRVMVAMVTVGNDTDPERRVAVVDIGVSAAGRLAHVPAALRLRRVDRGKELALPPLAIDGDGLTISGALLGFTLGADHPFLADGSDGNLGLYLRSRDGTLGVASFATLTDPVVVGLTDERGVEVVRAIARPGTDPADLTIEVTGGASETCELRVTAGGLREHWSGLPRDPEALARAIDGEVDPDGAATTRVTLEPDPEAPSPPPAVLIASGARPGSRLVHALPVPGREASMRPAVDNQVQRATQPRYRCVWTATAARRALRVREGASATASSDLRTESFDPADDLTIETWIKVEPGTSPNGSIVRHRSPRGSYDLSVDTAGERLAVAREQTVFRFARGSIVIGAAKHLDITGQITLEAWVEVDPSYIVAPAAFPRSIRNIVAHGWQPDPWWILNRQQAKRAEGTGEDFLRICNGRYQVGSCGRDGRERTAGYPIPAADLGQWVHLAGVYDGASWRLYRNGVEVNSSPDLEGAVARPGTPWRIGASTNAEDPRAFVGRIDDVRIWDRARTTEEIRQHLGEHLAAAKSWPELAGNWCADDGPVQDRSARAASCRTEGNVGRETAAFPERFLASDGVWVVAEVNGLRARAARALDGWTHVAATYLQGFAAQLADGRYLDGGEEVALDLTEDLTLEVFGRIDTLGRDNGLLAKGMPSHGTDGGMPYALAVDEAGRLVFAFVDDEGAPNSYTTPPWLQEGRPFRVAASRRRRMRSVQDHQVVWHEIVLTVDDSSEGRREATHWWAPRGVSIVAGEPELDAASAPPGTVFMTPAIGRGAGPLVIGRSYVTSPSIRSCAMHGCISEVRIWKEARRGISHPVRGDEAGLVSWWRFGERSGATVADSKGTSHARFIGPVRWRRDPDPRGSTLHLSLDGDVPTTGTVVDDPGREQPAERLTLFAPADEGAGFTGFVDELRLWRTARSRRQIQDEMYRRVSSDASEQLMASYDADISADAEERDADRPLFLDRSGAANHLHLVGGVFVTSDAPIGDDGPQIADLLRDLPTSLPTAIVQRPAVAVYGVMHDEGDGRLVGTLRRTYAVIRPNGVWDLLADFKVGDLNTEWVSQIQFNPQLKGYIEGAPPVPRENLGRQARGDSSDLDDYNRASSVMLLQADSSRFTYSVDVDRGFDQQWDLAVGAVFRTDASAGFGYVQKVFETDSFIGVHSRFENSYSWLQESVEDAGQTTRRATSLELRGRITRAGFLPDNVGLALVESETADLYALRLRRNDALVGYHLRPNPDIPADWNIIHFPIDPTYTKQGTLDGLVGRDPDDHYPNAKGQRAAWSYYKPKEAYELKDRIKREEAGRVQRFEGTRLPPGPGASKLPDLKRRNLVNTYVWTSDGGLFIESQETMDSRRDVSGGAYRFLGLGGIKTEMMFAATAGTRFTLDALFGGHLNRVETKAEDAATSFAVDVSVDGVERDIYERDAAGQATSRRTPGKVDAYRFMTFYLEPRPDNVEDFFGRVIDPLWLEESNEPAAAALRQISREATKGACWRVLHRVTFVSRVFELPSVAASTSQPSRVAEPQSVTNAVPSQLDRPPAVVDSTYELIKRLEPFLDTTDPQPADALQPAIGPALVAAHLDGLLDDSSEIAERLSEYRGTPTSEPVVPEPA
jgi:hypothetical protein